MCELDFCEFLSKLETEGHYKGCFVFEEKNPRLKDVIKAEGVSKGAGVYLIYGVEGQRESLLYIGKSGQINTNGKIGKQGLAKRLANSQGKENRELFFRKILRGEHENYPGLGPFEQLRFRWIETYKDGMGIAPFFAEAYLLAKFLSENKKLPPVNGAV